MQKNLKIGYKDFIIRTEYYMKMLGHQQRSSFKKGKRFRIAFTTEQVKYMEKQFRKNPYVTNIYRKEMASVLNIPEKAVKVWFQNRRMKEKKDNTIKDCNMEVAREMSSHLFEQQLKDISAPVSGDQQPYSSPICKKTNKNDLENNSKFSDCVSRTGPLISNLSKVNINCDSNGPGHTQPRVLQPCHPVQQTDCPKSAEPWEDLKCKTMSQTNSTKPYSIKQDDNGKHDLSIQLTNAPCIQQNGPEDLSLGRKENTLKQQTKEPKPSLNNSRYIFVVPDIAPQVQPYYPASGVLWNPVNVVPAMNSASAALYNQEELPNPKGTAVDKCCACNCHSSSSIATNMQQPSPSPQYIITAIQLPSTSANVTKC